MQQLKLIEACSALEVLSNASGIGVLALHCGDLSGDSRREDVPVLNFAAVSMQALMRCRAVGGSDEALSPAARLFDRAIGRSVILPMILMYQQLKTEKGWARNAPSGA